MRVGCWRKQGYLCSFICLSPVGASYAGLGRNAFEETTPGAYRNDIDGDNHSHGFEGRYFARQVKLTWLWSLGRSRPLVDFPGEAAIIMGMAKYPLHSGPKRLSLLIGL